MLKRFIVAFAALFVLATSAHAAGTISLSLSQQFDSLGKPLNGGKLYFIQAGTTSTPQNAYQDSALTIPWPNPLTLDAAGRVPQLHFADGNIKIRLTNAAGVTQIVADNILVVGASSGGGGGGTVDATTVLDTGDLKVRYGTGNLSGFVRANGRTIGSATSGATERANADCQALFEYLWGADANLSVSTGRGVSAAADWAANKTIALPDWRGRAIAALDDMGNTAAGRLTSGYFGTSATVLGAAGGAQNQTLVNANLPSHTHSGTTNTESASHNHNIASPQSKGGTSGGGGAFFGMWNNGVSGDATTTTGIENQTHTHSFITDGGTGSSTPFAAVSPMMLATVYLKL